MPSARANNLLAAMIDNHIYQGNSLNIDPRRITWRRCMDMNDRQLRNIVDGLAEKATAPQGGTATISPPPSEDHGRALPGQRSGGSESQAGPSGGGLYLRKSLGAETGDRRPASRGGSHVRAAEGRSEAQSGPDPGAHPRHPFTGGPFANIAHGCNSVTATRMALKLGDYLRHGSRFRSGSGSGKVSGYQMPDGRDCGQRRSDRRQRPGPEAQRRGCHQRSERRKSGGSEKGLPNLLKHVSNIRNVYHLPCVVAINAFPPPTQRRSWPWWRKNAGSWASAAALSEGLGQRRRGEGSPWRKKWYGSARRTIPASPSPMIWRGTIEEKLQQIVTKIYGGSRVVPSPANARKQAEQLEAWATAAARYALAKTQYSLFRRSGKAGRPHRFFP